MAIVRLFGLILLCLFVTAVGSGTNGAAKIAAIVSFPAYIGLYMLPTIEANINKQRNITPIALVNLLAGWTFIGWVVALVWAHKKQDDVPVYKATSPVAKAGTKVCPFCAEEIKAEAIKCRHCGSALEV